MGQRADILKVAASQIGYREGANNNTKYGAWYGLNNNPWCMMFVSWCAARANISTAIIPKVAYVPYCVDFYQRQGRYHSKGEYTPQPGDIIFFGNSSHTGLVEQVRDNRVYTIEGNTSAGSNSSNGDGVYRHNYTLNNSWIQGYGSPAYEGDEEMDIQDIQILNSESGQIITVSGFYQEGTNYIRLRDLQKLAPMIVAWDEVRRIPTVRPNYAQE